MDVARYRQILVDKERDLLAEIARLESEVRESIDGSPADLADQAASSEEREVVLEENTLAWQTLQQVRGALERIEAGTFGKCVDCGRPIEPARLEAVPWSPYCIQDQEKHDREPEV